MPGSKGQGQGPRLWQPTGHGCKGQGGKAPRTWAPGPAACGARGRGPWASGMGSWTLGLARSLEGRGPRSVGLGLATPGQPGQGACFLCVLAPVPCSTDMACLLFQKLNDDDLRAILGLLRPTDRRAFCVAAGWKKAEDLGYDKDAVIEEARLATRPGYYRAEFGRRLRELEAAVLEALARPWEAGARMHMQAAAPLLAARLRPLGWATATEESDGSDEEAEHEVLSATLSITIAWTPGLPERFSLEVEVYDEPPFFGGPLIFQVDRSAGELQRDLTAFYGGVCFWFAQPLGRFERRMQYMRGEPFHPYHRLACNAMSQALQDVFPDPVPGPPALNVRHWPADLPV